MNLSKYNHLTIFIVFLVANNLQKVPLLPCIAVCSSHWAAMELREDGQELNRGSIDENDHYPNCMSSNTACDFRAANPAIRQRAWDEER